MKCNPFRNPHRLRGSSRRTKPLVVVRGHYPNPGDRRNQHVTLLETAGSCLGHSADLLALVSS